jgi:hypothetical protein
MATFFKNKIVKDIGTVPVVALTPPANTNSTIVGLSLSNLTEFAVKASVIIKDDTSVEGFYMKDVIVPANTSLRAVTAGEKLIISEQYELLIKSDIPDSLDAVVSYVDIV